MTKTFRDNCDKNIVQQTSCEPLFPDVKTSNSVKNVLHRSFYTPMYASQSWWTFRKWCMQRLHVAYNFGCRSLYYLPRRASVSSHDSSGSMWHSYIWGIIKKKLYVLLERCRRSNNVRLPASTQSDCLYSSLFFEHYNCVLLCDWVLGHYSVYSFDGVHATMHFYVTWPWPV